MPMMFIDELRLLAESKRMGEPTLHVTVDDLRPYNSPSKQWVDGYLRDVARWHGVAELEGHSTEALRMMVNALSGKGVGS